MKRILNLKKLPWLAASLAVMAAIFLFSSHSGGESTGVSTKVTELICNVIFFNFDEMTLTERLFIIGELNPFIRKLAHFTVYLLLGIFVFQLVRTPKLIRVADILTALLICGAYAASDEIHQFFTPGRAMRLTDILIDSSGALCGIAAVILLSAAIKGFAADKQS